MEVLETWIYALVDKSFVRVNGVEYACALDGPDVQLFANYDAAIEVKASHQEELYKLGFHLVGSDYEASDPSLCYWSRVENSEGFAHVLAIYKKSVFGDLFQVRHS